MGIGKSTEGYSVYDEYTADTLLFLRNISDSLNADFIVNTYDKNYEPMHEKDLRISFGRQNTYDLTITHDEYTVKDTRIELPTYELRLPINYIYGETIELMIYPSRAVLFMFLTFEHMWSYFIDTLKFQDPFNRTFSLDRYERLRKQYSNILKLLGMEAMFISTHAYYHIESLDDIEEYPKLRFPDIPIIAKEKDGLNIFQFEDILYAKSKNDLSKDFLNASDLNIAFVDNLTFK